MDSNGRNQCHVEDTGRNNKVLLIKKKLKENCSNSPEMKVRHFLK